MTGHDTVYIVSLPVLGTVSYQSYMKHVHVCDCTSFIYYLFIYYETRTKVHEKEKKKKKKKKNTRKTHTIENIQKIQKTHITKNTSHGAYIVHN